MSSPPQGPLAGPGSWQRPLTDHVIKETGHTSPAAPVGPSHPKVLYWGGWRCPKLRPESTSSPDSAPSSENCQLMMGREGGTQGLS